MSSHSGHGRYAVASKTKRRGEEWRKRSQKTCGTQNLRKMKTWEFNFFIFFPSLIF
jgi:hypothetical protein